MSTLNVNNINEVGGVDAVIASGVLDSGSLPAGSILQVVRATSTANVSTTSTSLTDITDMSVTITPKSSSSTVYVFVTAMMNIVNSGSTNQQFIETAITDSSNVALTGGEGMNFGTQNLSDTSTVRWFTQTFLASVLPATTASQTYKLRYRTGNASATVSFRGDSTTGQMIAMEVAG